MMVEKLAGYYSASRGIRDDLRATYEKHDEITNLHAHYEQQIERILDAHKRQIADVLRQQATRAMNFPICC